VVVKKIPYKCLDSLIAAANHLAIAESVFVGRVIFTYRWERRFVTDVSNRNSINGLCRLKISQKCLQKTENFLEIVTKN
jgi:hypothetical protein